MSRRWLEHFEIPEGETAYCKVIPARKRGGKLVYECFKVDPNDPSKSSLLGVFGEIRDLDAKDLNLSISIGDEVPIISFTVASGKGCRVFKNAAYGKSGDLARCRYKI